MKKILNNNNMGDEKNKENWSICITEIDYAGESNSCTIFSVCLSDCLLSWSVNGRCFLEDIGKNMKNIKLAS